MSVKEFTDKTFDKEVMRADKPVVVDFWAPWCGPCKMMAPVIESLAKRFTGQIIIGKLNVDENPETAAKLKIGAIPALLYVKNGQILDLEIGVRSEAELTVKLLSL